MPEEEARKWVATLDAYRSELSIPYLEYGALHIIRNKVGAASGPFVVTFSSNNRSGAMKPKALPDVTSLTKYLRECVGLSSDDATKAVVEAEQNGTSDIQIALRRDQQRVLGLR
jgi:hypothetical protein